ncbi:MAG TPA: carboxypeptidase-like regulatory domain-containing protein, partial [Methylomirabilota bacterium]|nr:carboxypeptidase-like regulatory domain-containing protein [Methylomirabilota bacterium]
MNERIRVVMYVAIALVVALFAANADLHAQATASSSLQGTITDQSGAIIKGAKVALVSKAQGWTRDAESNDSGFYRFELLPAGFYNVKVTASGFAAAEAINVELQVGVVSTQNFTLKPGSVAETVEVTATAPLMDQTKMDVRTDVTPDQIQELPLIGRDIADLAFLA